MVLQNQETAFEQSAPVLLHDVPPSYSASALPPAVFLAGSMASSVRVRQFSVFSRVFVSCLSSHQEHIFRLFLSCAAFFSRFPVHRRPFRHGEPDRGLLKCLR